MQDINLTGPLMDAIIASVTTGTTATLTVADIDAAIAQLDQHGGTQSLTRSGDTITGVFLGIEFSIRLINKTNKSTNTMNTYSEYTVNISTEPSYYGSSCTQLDADRIADSLENLIRTEFPGIQTKHYVDGIGNAATNGPDQAVVEQINAWIESNWTAAL